LSLTAPGDVIPAMMARSEKQSLHLSTLVFQLGKPSRCCAAITAAFQLLLSNFFSIRSSAETCQDLMPDPNSTNDHRLVAVFMARF
jgi:hypothetical protein